MKLAVVIVLVICAFLLPQAIQAFDIANTFFGTGPDVVQHTTLATIYNPIIRFVYILGGMTILISFLYGGFKIIQGTPKDLEEGRNIIFGGFAGFVVLMSVYWISLIVGTVIGTNPTSGSTGPTPPPIGTATPIPTPTFEPPDPIADHLIQQLCVARNCSNGSFICFQNAMNSCSAIFFTRNCYPCP